MTLHGGDEAPRAKRRKKSASLRRFAEEFDQGDRIEWDSPPHVRSGPDVWVAPSNRGRVAFIVSGGALVRFEVEGGRTEATEVLLGQPCKEVDE